MHDLHSYPLEENFLIHSAEEGRLYILNSSGHFILEHFKADRPIPEVAQRMALQYGIPFETALNDIETAITEWRRIGLLPGHTPGHGHGEVPGATPPHQSRPIDVTRYYQLPGLRFSVRYDCEVMERQCHPRLSAIETPAPDKLDAELEIRSNDAIWVVTLNDRELSRTVSSNEARIELLIGILTGYHQEIQIMAMIHAGVVASGDKAIVLPATTQGGKSTLTAALIYAGHLYLSDDTAPIDGPSGRVYPFPLGLSLRPGSWPVVDRMFPELRNHKALKLPYEAVKVMLLPRDQTIFEPLAVSALIFPAYGPGRRNTLQILSLTEALVQLSKAGFWVPLQGGQIPCFLDWARPIPCYQLEYSCLDAAVDLIGGLTL